MQVIVMTSDKQSYLLKGFLHQWRKYFNHQWEDRILVCGFTSPTDTDTDFFSIGPSDNYPANKWSDALITVLDKAADEVFLLMLEDYWLTRPVDVWAIKMIYDYCHQFQNVIKFDVTTDRLFANGGGQYLYGFNTYDTLGYLDLIKSDFTSPYHLSLWGGMWRRNLLRRFLVEGETAQQIELNGTHRLAQTGDELLVLGTRQAPLKHANVFQRGQWNEEAMTGLPSLTEGDREELKRLGYL